MTEERLRDIAHRVRRDVIEMGYYANSKNQNAHYGGGLSCVEILTVLLADAMQITPQTLNSKERDVLMPGKAHCILPQYAVLYELGCITREEMLSFTESGGTLYGHPFRPDKGVDFPGGSLGMVLPVSVGMALGKREKHKNQKIYCLLGDGECDEGSVWEAAMAAAHFKLENLIAIVDRNYVQADGLTEETMALGEIGEKFKAFGWHTITTDGHDINALQSALSVKNTGQPKAIIANTVKGKGVSFMEGRSEWHLARMTRTQYEQAMLEVNDGI